MNCSQISQTVTVKAVSGSTPSAEKSASEVEEEKSDVYSNNMTEAMGAVLTCRHERGMNYNFICPDLIVGSCLQTKRSCSPNLDAIKNATADILSARKKLVTLTLRDRTCSLVEISGLDNGWDQRVPLQFDGEQGVWTLKWELPVLGIDPSSANAALQKDLTADDP